MTLDGVKFAVLTAAREVQRLHLFLRHPYIQDNLASNGGVHSFPVRSIPAGLIPLPVTGPPLNDFVFYFYAHAHCLFVQAGEHLH